MSYITAGIFTGGVIPLVEYDAAIDSVILRWPGGFSTVGFGAWEARQVAEQMLRLLNEAQREGKRP